MSIGKLYGKIIPNVTIESAGSEGLALTRVDGQVIFVKYGVPGDVADIRLFAKKKKVLFAEIDKIIEPSINRVDPFCSHFGTCGGCKWQQMDYATQLFWKNQQVKDAFERLGKVECNEWMPIVGAPDQRNYRNKLEYAFSNKRWLMHNEQVEPGSHLNAAGFHIAGRFDKILDIETCHLQDDLGNAIRLFIKDYGLKNKLSFYDIKAQTGYLRNVMIRNTTLGQWMVVMIVGEENEEATSGLMTALGDNFPEITSLIYGVNTKVNDTIYDVDLVTCKGQDYIEEKLEDITYCIRPKSFFQTNSAQALNLYKITRDFAGLTGKELVYDLYCGTGSISLFVARNAAKVFGIESVPQAIEDAKENAKNNGISNVEFTVGDMRFELNDTFVSKTGKPDVVITDPPRAGMHPDVVSQLLKMEPEKIVYVSCNPATQARDLAVLNEKYTIIKTCPVDMFPHTHHVENVTLLRLNLNS
jgi:23S rRNA (uracil1939-C5)-methyltransferase